MKKKNSLLFILNVLFDNVSTERYNKIYGNPRRWIKKRYDSET